MVSVKILRDGCEINICTYMRMTCILINKCKIKYLHWKEKPSHLHEIAIGPYVPKCQLTVVGFSFIVINGLLAV